jgi:hypothetical protein
VKAYVRGLTCARVERTHATCGYSLVAELDLAKIEARFRLPLSAPDLREPGAATLAIGVGSIPTSMKHRFAEARE